MNTYLPLYILAALIGTVTTALIIAYSLIKNKKEAIGFERNMKDSEIILRIGKFAKPYIGSFIIVLFIILASIAYIISSPLIVGAIENLIREPDFSLKKLYSLVTVYAVILIVSIICVYIRTIILQRTGQKIVSNVRMALFDHIESLSHGQLSSIPVGKLVTRVTNDTDAISRMFTGIFANLLRNIFVIIAVLIAMFSVNIELSLVVLAFSPFILVFTNIFRKFSRKTYRKVKESTTDVNTFLSENLSGMKIIQIFNREDAKLGEFAEKNTKLRKAQRDRIFVFSVFRPLVYMLYISALTCIFYFGGRGCLDNTHFLGQVIDSGTIVTFYMFASKFFDPIQQLAEQFNLLQSAFASGEKILSIFDIKPDIVDEPDAIELDNIEGRIEFRNVWFSYLPGEWVLKDVSFTVEPGQTVAFVGSTGSGKTTILSLICRNYEIQKGQILIDGIDIKKIKLSSLRRHFGQMLQDVFLFSGTVRSNISLRESFSDDELNEACKYVNADKFISHLDHGLDEEIRERGSNLSAGQRQLISFARTIIHKPEIMILDEATANIDTETELLIQNSLEKMMNIGTMLIVAHRLSTIRNADNIFVISHGKIVESGNHEELLEKKGRYYSLYTLQSERENLASQSRA
ncbi:MAG: ABC transporter ATP-binding protein [Clostridia bacterium]|nr:ABC transporter ATP-binding protein [Clostridia bacterium]